MTLQDLGQSLQEKREAAGLSIDDVAARIKVSGRILRSIEQGSMEGLPHAIYTKSFIRSFGLLVGYDPEDLTASLDKVFPPESLDESKKERSIHVRPVMSSSGGGRTVMVFVMLLVILGALGAGGWWVAKNYGDVIVDFVKKPFSAISFSSSTDNNGRTTQPAAPEQTASAPQAPAPSAPEPAAPVGQTTSSAGSSPEGDLVTTISPPADAPAEGGAAAAEPPQPATAGTEPAREEPAVATPPADTAYVMVITAESACWMGPTVDGEKLPPFTLKEGQTHTINFNSKLELVLGNPSGISLNLNGQDLGAPDPKDRVMQFP